MIHFPARALTIAGSDCSGGAGIQTDLKTFTRFKTYGLSVITAITAQNTKGVTHSWGLSAFQVESQLASIFGDIRIDALKTGMLQNEEIIRVVVKAIRGFPAQKIVVDPVMVAKGGARLLETCAESALIKDLIPLAEIITPNVPEAEAILGVSIENLDSQIQAAKKLLELGPKSVLLKGGHIHSEICTDVWVSNDLKQAQIFSSPRVLTNNTHGTGCTLSAAITANLALKSELQDAIHLAREYVQNQLHLGQDLFLSLDEKGHGPVSF